MVQLQWVIPPFLIEPIDCTADCSRPVLYLVYNVISVYFKSNENWSVRTIRSSGASLHLILHSPRSRFQTTSKQRANEAFSEPKHNRGIFIMDVWIQPAKHSRLEKMGKPHMASSIEHSNWTPSALHFELFNIHISTCRKKLLQGIHLDYYRAEKQNLAAPAHLAFWQHTKGFFLLCNLLTIRALSPPVGYPLHLGNKNCYYKLFNFLLSTTLFKSLFTHSFSHFLSFSFSISLFLLVSPAFLIMQSTIHVIPTDHDVDAHAPASTYYTTGSNSSGALNRLKTYTVSARLVHNDYSFPCNCSNKLYGLASNWCRSIRFSKHASPTKSFTR